MCVKICVRECVHREKHFAICLWHSLEIWDCCVLRKSLLAKTKNKKKKLNKNPKWTLCQQQKHLNKSVLSIKMEKNKITKIIAIWKIINQKIFFSDSCKSFVCFYFSVYFAFCRVLTNFIAQVCYYYSAFVSVSLHPVVLQ